MKVRALIVASAFGLMACGTSASPASQASPSPTATTITTTVATVSTIVASSVVTKETVLETTDGLTLYYFVKGDTGKTTPQCTGTCASTWIPYTLATGTPTGTSDLTASSLGTVTNTDKNAPQVTYKGWPLYTYVKDFGPGDATGNGVGGGSWLAATPDMPQHM